MTPPDKRAIDEVRFNAGVQLGALVFSSLSTVINGAEMSVCPIGLDVVWKGKFYTVPYALINSIRWSGEQLAPDHRQLAIPGTEAKAKR